MKLKSLTARLAALLCACGFAFSAWADLPGSGTEADPYTISSLAQLKEFRDSVNASETSVYKGKYVRLDVNVDLNNEQWTPIGNTMNTPLNCIFDGNGNTISNLYINDSSMNIVGFIGATSYATVKNLKVHNANLTGNDYVGAIAGRAYAVTTVQNCEVSGSIRLSGNHYVGGITGSGYATVTGCKTIGDGVATSYIHGADAVANAGDGDDVGGIIGLDEGGTSPISDCYVSDVTIEGFRQVGGIAGLIQGGRPVVSCSVKDVVVKCIADQYTVDNKAARMAFGGIVGAISQTGGGSVTGCTVENVQLVRDPVGVSVARMGYISGGYYNGADGFLIPDRLSSTITGADNTVVNVVRATEGLQAPAVPNIVIDGPVAVAQIGANKYETLAAAIDAAEDGDTIELIADVQLSGTEEIDINKVGTYTIDGDGHSITPAESTEFAYHRFLFGMSGDAYTATKNYTLKNVTISGFTDSAYLVRAEGCSLTLRGCTLENNNLPYYNNSNPNSIEGSRVVLTTDADLTIDGCTIRNNTTTFQTVDFNTNGKANKTGGTLDIVSSLFSGNSSTGSGVIYSYGSSSGGDKIRNSTFTGNTVNSAAAAVIYFSGATDVTGCLFTGNTVTATDSTQKCGVLALGSGAAGSEYTGNAFVNNTLTAAGHVATIYGGAENVDLGANYWGGNAPTVADGGDLYLAKTEGVTYATYAESYALIEGTGPGVTVTLYVPPVAQIGDVTYATFAAAIDAAEAYAAEHGGAYPTITVLNGATEQENTRWSIVDGYLVRNYFYQDASDANLWHIENLEGLKAFRDSVNGGEKYTGKTIQLDADIDLSLDVDANSQRISWVPIGLGNVSNQRDSTIYFGGVFDGTGKTISNLKINDSNLAGAGLFGVAKSGGIRNITLTNVNITAKSWIGSLVGCSWNSKLTNCHVTGTIALDGHYMMGGLVGQSYSDFENCSVDGTSKTTSHVIATYLGNDLEADKVGGITGHWKDGFAPGRMINCSVSNLSVAGSRDVGGIIGLNRYYDILEDCSASDIIVTANTPLDYAESKSSKIHIGGAIGSFQTGTGMTGSVEVTVQNIDLRVTTPGVESIAKMGYVSGGAYGVHPLSAPSNVTNAGIVVTGTNSSQGIQSCNNVFVQAPGVPVATVTISGVATNYGDLHEALEAGKAKGAVVTLLKDVDLAGVNWVPVGDATAFNGTFDGQNHIIRNLTGSGTTNVGLFGHAVGATIRNVTISNVTFTASSSHVGALIGHGDCFTASNCVVIGTINISGSSNAGGLVGTASNAQWAFRDCLVDGTSANSSTVSSSNMVGGLVGNTDYEGVVSDCTVKNVTVRGPKKVGGLIGQFNYDNDANHNDTSDLVSVSGTKVESVTVDCTATAQTDDYVQIGGLFGILYRDNAKSDFASVSITATVKNVTVNGIEASTKGAANAGIVSGGYRKKTVTDSQTQLAGDNVVFNITFEGTNTVTGNTNYSDYIGIYNPAPYVAQIGETQYETLQAAFNAVADGETITLLTDVTQDDGILFNREGVSAKLDLNEKTLTVNKGSNVNSRAIRIDNGTLEVYNGTIAAVGAGTTSSNGTGCYGAFRVEANGVLNAHDLSLSNARPWGLCVKICGGEATLTRVTITSSYGGGIEVTEANLGTHSKTGSATLTDCTFTQTGYFDHCSSCLAVSGGSALTINSGTYTSETGYALYVYSSGGVITVNGGTFSGNKDGIAIIAAIDTNTYSQYVGGLALKGGDFTGGYSITYPAYMTVTGGRYSGDPAAYVAANYSTALVDGKYVIVNAVAKIGDKYFATLDAAYAAAKEGDTIQLLADITYGTDREVATWSKAVNLNLGGFTLETKSEVAIDAANGGYKAAAICYTIPASDPVKQVTVSNGTIITAYGAGIYADDPGLELTLSDLTIRAATVGTQATKEYSSAVRITYGSKVIINDGSFTGPNAIAVSNSGGRYEITGGEFVGDLYISDYHSTEHAQEIVISGGYFDSIVPAKYCATGYVPTTRPAANGLYTVTTPATVTYTLAGTGDPVGAALPAPVSFTYPSGDLAEIALAVATCTATDYTFAGWKINGAGNALSALPAGTTGDVTLVATWTKATKIEVEIVVAEATQETEEVKQAVEVKVTDEWVEANVGSNATEQQVQTALTTTQDNGLTGLENYLLGLDGKTATAKVKVDSEQGASEKAMPVKNTLAEKVQTADTGFKVQYSIDKVNAETGATVENGEGTKQDTSDLALDLTTVGSDAAYYKMTATITKTVTSGNETTEVEVSTVKSENTIGVLKVESAAKTTVIGVPWTSLEKDESISVNDLVRTSTLSEGDQIQVYDKTANGYRSWTIQNGKWTADTVIGSGAGTGDADTVTVDRGKGVLLTRSDTTKPIYLVGSADKQTESVSTTVDAAETTSKPAWNLVASPKPVEVEVNDVAETTDTVIVPTDTAPRNYTYKDGVWGYDGLDSETITNKLGIIIVKPKRVTGDTTIPAGKGFWYLNKGTSDKTINW